MFSLLCGILMQGGGPMIKSIQHVTHSGSLTSITIDPVVMDNTMLIGNWGGTYDSSSGGYADFELTSATTIDVYTDDSRESVLVYIVEFDEGVIKSKQSGNISFGSSDLTKDVTITSVDPDKCICLHDACTSGNSCFGYATTATNLHFSKTDAKSSTYPWVLYEFS